MKTPTLDMSRFSVGQKLNERQALLKPFCDRMPSIPKSTVASLMSHISTDELDATYTHLDKNARNFTALWRWHFMPKSETKKSQTEIKH